jgi:Tfp pilus assembly protein PilN
VIAELNLASQPFRNRALPSLAAFVLTCVALVALVFIVADARETNARAARIERELKALQSERDKLNAKAQEVRGQLSPEEQRTLEAAHLIVDRKRFSWSRLFADLERVLPKNVRVARIGVRGVARTGDQTRADLDLTVVGRAPDDVTAMIYDMERTGIFAVEPVSENPRPSRGEVGTEWTLRVLYTQRVGSRSGGEAEARGESSEANAR